MCETMKVKTLKFQIFLISTLLLVVLTAFSMKSFSNALHEERLTEAFTAAQKTESLNAADMKVSTLVENMKLAAKQSRNNSLGLLLFSLLSTTALIVWSRKSILQPIARLTRITNRIALGELYAELDVPVKTSEVGQLMESIEVMANNLKTTTVSWNDLIESQERLRERTKELTRLNEKLETEMSQRQNAEKRINHMAYHDSLTGLPNRYLFNDRLHMCIADVERNQTSAAVLLVGIDDIKRINDTLGHNEGDLLLQEVAEKITGCIRAVDSVTCQEIYDVEESTVARLGGDEFTILLTALKDSQDMVKVARRIMESVSKPFCLGENEIFITVSIGIAICPDDGKDAEQIMKNVDVALFHAKKQGKNNFQFYKGHMNGIAHKQLQMESDLRKAIRKNEMHLYYQPRVDAITGNVIAAEALARWKKSEGMVSPGEFIPVAEESGLIVPIGEWILRTACVQYMEWQEAGIPAESISVNISVKQFLQEDFISTVSNALKDTGMKPQCLELEITENILMQNAGKTISMLNELKAMGIKLAMDDFGTGYSSFNYLIQFPLDVIKIDMSFIRDITERADHAAIVKAIIIMAHSLHLSVVAEGVETKSQLEILKEFGCDEIQGYYYSPPLPTAEFAKYYEESGQKPKPVITNFQKPEGYSIEGMSNPGLL